MEWISVKDRLPNHNQRVLACEAGNDYHWISWLMPSGNKIWGDGFCTATHWQPLPEPPKQ